MSDLTNFLAEARAYPQVNRGWAEAIPERPQYLRDFANWVNDNGMRQMLLGGAANWADKVYWDQKPTAMDNVMASLDISGITPAKAAAPIVAGTAGLLGLMGRNTAKRGVDWGKQAGAIGSKNLPMDEASRMQRAKEMGFDRKAYRGLPEPYDKKKNSHLTWTTDDPEYASAYAYGGPDGTNIGKGGNVMPIQVKADNPFDFGFRSQHTEVKYGDMLDRLLRGTNQAFGEGKITRDKGLAIMDKIEDLRLDDPDVDKFKPVFSWWNNKPEMIDILKDLKFDSLAAKEGATDAVSTLAIFDPKNIRSRFAKFDPAKKDSSNLLAGGLLGTVGLGAYRQEQQ